MNQHQADAGRCTIVGADKLSPEIGSELICDAITAAADEKSAGALHHVKVTVLSPSSLAAVVTLSGGRVLPEQKMAVNDRQLNRGSIDRFAAAVAAEIATSSQR